jgi:hypothetical protein
MTRNSPNRDKARRMSATPTCDVIALVPAVDPGTGRTVYGDLTIRDGAIHSTQVAATFGDTGVEEVMLSRLPEGRMAGTASWDDIARALDAAEEGCRTRADAVMQPGGALVLSRDGGQSTQLSRLPQGRMAGQ